MDFFIEGLIENFDFRTTISYENVRVCNSCKEEKLFRLIKWNEKYGYIKVFKA